MKDIKLYTIVIVLTSLCFIARFWTVKNESDKVWKHNQFISFYKKKLIEKDTFKLTQKYVYSKLVKADIKYPKIVLKQAILETGHFKSNVCLKYKNLFGFYNGHRYLTFKNYQECIDFCKVWQDRRYKSGDYYKFLEELPYARDTTYVNRLKQIKINV